MPQTDYGPNDLVYIYDLAYLRFGTIKGRCQEREVVGPTYETYTVHLLDARTIVICSPSQLRRAIWTFVGPMVVSGEDVLEGFDGAPQHMHIEVKI